MGKRDEQIHVVMIPWSAFGHMIPFFQLAIALAKFGIKTSFVSTPRNIQRLPKIPPNISHLIDLVALPLPKLDPGLLPEGAEATVDIPADKIPYLKIAYDQLKELFGDFVKEKLPNWIMMDFAPYWAADIARELNIPVLAYCMMTAATLVLFTPKEEGVDEKEVKALPESLTVTPDTVGFSSEVTYRNFEATNVHSGYYGENASGKTDAERIAILRQAVQALAIRSCPEFESEYLKSYENITGKPVFPVGFLPPEKSEKKIEMIEEPWRTTFNWLDEQEPKSVVFVGFGSETKLEKEQLHEIAYGVELSGLPFLWALRKPDWSTNDLDCLPPDFSSRTAGRGVVHVGWAPQMEILAHHSVGGSLFHAGWGSIIETLQHGHNLVFLPFVIDQPLNARLMLEKGLGIEVERAEDGSFSRNDIADALRKAMVLKEGEESRRRAKEAAERIFGNEKLHASYVEKFVDYLRNGIR